MFINTYILIKTIIVSLTSRDSRQYQQKACLQFLHIICAQPSSLSIQTLHFGQRLIGTSSSSSFSKNELDEGREKKNHFQRILVQISQTIPQRLPHHIIIVEISHRCQPRQLFSIAICTQIKSTHQIKVQPIYNFSTWFLLTDMNQGFYHQNLIYWHFGHSIL